MYISHFGIKNSNTIQLTEKKMNLHLGTTLMIINILNNKKNVNNIMSMKIGNEEISSCKNQHESLGPIKKSSTLLVVGCFKKIKCMV